MLSKKMKKILSVVVEKNASFLKLVNIFTIFAV